MFEINHANKKIICYIAEVLILNNENLAHLEIMGIDLQIYNGIRNR